MAYITLAPDVVERQVFVFNNQLPGPTIEADWETNLSFTFKIIFAITGISPHTRYLITFNVIYKVAHMSRMFFYDEDRH